MDILHPFVLPIDMLYSQVQVTSHKKCNLSLDPGDGSLCSGWRRADGPNLGTLTKSAQSINSFHRSYGVPDVWRFCNPTSRSYSYFSQVYKTYSRVDYFFLDKQMVPLVKECDYGAIVISDRGPLIMKLLILVTQSVNCPWRLNLLLLFKEDFIKFLTSKIELFLEVNQTRGIPLCTVWEALQAHLRGQIIYCCANKKKKSWYS